MMTGLKAEAAAVYTLHSCRHTYPTYAGQLLMPPEAVSLMGHWETKHKMPSEYESTRISHELAFKSYVVENVQKGWLPVDEGSVPNPPVVCRPGYAFEPGPTAAARDSGDTQVSKGVPGDDTVLKEKYKGEAELLASSHFVLPLDVVQVLNMKTNTVHLTTGDQSACRSWMCGVPGNPHPQAEYSKSSDRWTVSSAVHFCRQCYALKTVSRLGGTMRVDGDEVTSSSCSWSDS